MSKKIQSNWEAIQIGVQNCKPHEHKKEEISTTSVTSTDITLITLYDSTGCSFQVTSVHGAFSETTVRAFSTHNIDATVPVPLGSAR